MSYGDEGAPHERRQWANAANGNDIRAEEQVVDGGTFTGNKDEREQDNRAAEVGVPRQAQSTALYNLQCLLDNDRVHSCDHGAGDAERDAYE